MENLIDLIIILRHHRDQFKHLLILDQCDVVAVLRDVAWSGVMLCGVALRGVVAWWCCGVARAKA